jgi:hypothetical protein
MLTSLPIAVTSSGTAVSLIASSMYRRDHFALAPVTEADQGWYHAKDMSVFDRKMKALKLLAGEHDDEYAKDLFTRIEPRTCSQGTSEWFIDQQFAATSSTMCAIILSVAPLIDQEEDPTLWASFDTVLRYAGVKDTLLGSVVRERPRKRNDGQQQWWQQKEIQPAAVMPRMTMNKPIQRQPQAIGSIV